LLIVIVICIAAIAAGVFIAENHLRKKPKLKMPEIYSKRLKF